MNKLLITLLVMPFLAGCATTGSRPSTFEPKTTVRVVTERVYPQLAQINIPETPNLKSVHWDYPRDVNADEIIKNTTTCRSVPIEKQDIEFWAKCGEAPIETNSNIFIGLDQEQFNNLNYNLETLRQYINLLRSRIGIANDQRKEFNKEANK